MEIAQSYQLPKELMRYFEKHQTQHSCLIGRIGNQEATATSYEH